MDHERPFDRTSGQRVADRIRRPRARGKTVTLAFYPYVFETRLAPKHPKEERRKLISRSTDCRPDCKECSRKVGRPRHSSSLVRPAGRGEWAHARFRKGRLCAPRLLELAAAGEGSDQGRAHLAGAGHPAFLENISAELRHAGSSRASAGRKAATGSRARRRRSSSRTSSARSRAARQCQRRSSETIEYSGPAAKLQDVDRDAFRGAVLEELTSRTWPRKAVAGDRGDHGRILRHMAVPLNTVVPLGRT